MLFRYETDSIVAIPQPSHAWLSGQLARAWGNELFVAPEPYEEVCLGAEQHDIAWLEWERCPTFNPATGLPHEFREIDVETRVALWTKGIELALGFGLYPALLVSLHAHTIHAILAPPKAPAMLAFLEEQHRLRQAMRAALAAQPRYRDVATPEVTERNRLLIYAVDRLSLEICWGVRDEVIVPGVSPDGHVGLDLRLRSRHGEPDDLILDPWPFRGERCRVLCEGRRLRGRFTDETSLREAPADPWSSVMIEAELRPR